MNMQILLLVLVITAHLLQVAYAQGLPGVTAHATQTEARFSDAIIGLNVGENKFAWGVFNDGEDEVSVTRMRIQIVGDGVRVVSEVKEYTDMRVRPMEELSMPFIVSLPASDFPNIGSILVTLDMRDEDGRTYTRELLQKRVRFPESVAWGIVSAFTIMIASAILLIMVAYIYLAISYGSDGVADFISSRGDFAALAKANKRRSYS